MDNGKIAILLDKKEVRVGEEVKIKVVAKFDDKEIEVEPKRLTLDARPVGKEKAFVLQKAGKHNIAAEYITADKRLLSCLRKIEAQEADTDDLSDEKMKAINAKKEKAKREKNKSSSPTEKENIWGTTKKHLGPRRNKDLYAGFACTSSFAMAFHAFMISDYKNMLIYLGISAVLYLVKNVLPKGPFYRFITSTGEALAEDIKNTVKGKGG